MDFIDQLRIPSDEVEMIAIDQGYFESDSKPIEFVDTDQISLQKILTFVEKIQDLDEKYILGRTIGVGEFARVKIATCVADGQTVSFIHLRLNRKLDNRLGCN